MTFWLGIGLLAVSIYLFALGGAGSKWLPALFVGGLIAISGCAHAQERPGHTHEGAVGKFYQSWMMPDSPRTSCCHDQDCSPIASRLVNGEWEAEVDGEWIRIPSHKIEQDRDSPDGRSHLCGRKFWSGFAVFCFIRGGGA
jgi:hypothetical protein